MSSPALSAVTQESLLQPCTCACPFQSPTTNPSKPILPTSTSVSISFEPCIFRPWKLLARNHYRLDARRNGRRITGCMDIAQIHLR